MSLTFLSKAETAHMEKRFCCLKIGFSVYYCGFNSQIDELRALICSAFSKLAKVFWFLCEHYFCNNNIYKNDLESIGNLKSKE